MANMFTYCVLLALYAAGAKAGADWKYFHVKFALWDGYYNMPLTLSEIKADNPPKFVLMAHDDDLNVDLYSYPGDPRVSLMFDTYGNIAGLRTGYIKADVGNRARSKNMTFPPDYFDSKPMYTSGNYWDTDVWYTSVLFADPATLLAGGRNDTGGLVAENVYVRLDGGYVQISKDECKVEAQGFTKQACFMGMGMHYFYQMAPTTDCKDLQGVFLLYECGELIGLGLIPFGSFTSKDRTWFEDPPASVVKMIVPNRPSCLTDWVTDYGTSSIHLFFKRFPRLTFCVWPWQKSDQCKK